MILVAEPSHSLRALTVVVGIFLLLDGEIDRFALRTGRIMPLILTIPIPSQLDGVNTVLKKLAKEYVIIALIFCAIALWPAIRVIVPLLTFMKYLPSEPVTFE